MDVFIGKLHPLLVHLPIGFVLLTFILELLVKFRKSWEVPRRWILAGYLVSGIAAILTVITGLLLADNAYYVPDELNSHKWFAIGATVLIWILVFIKARWTYRSLWSLSASVSLIVLISVAGHFGGTLTHGKYYLVENAPQWIQKIAGGMPQHWNESIDRSQPDSVQIYLDIVRPILDRHCTGCHNADVQSGGFMASTYAGLFEQADEGRPIVPGKPGESELLRRLMISPFDKEFMPPVGKPVGYNEIAIIKYWIARGADSLARFDHASMPPELIEFLIDEYQLDYRPRPMFERIRVDSIDAVILKDIASKGFDVTYLGQNNYLLDLVYRRDTLSPDLLVALDAVARNIAFLDISGVWITSERVDFSRFPHLLRANLSHTNINDSSMQSLGQLEYLEVLNLVQTSVTDDGLGEALAAPGLARVYVWNSKVSEDFVNKARDSYPDVDFIFGKKLVKSKIPDTLNVTPE